MPFPDWPLKKSDQVLGSAVLFPSQGFAGGGTEHFGIPGWIPDQRYFGAGYSRDGLCGSLYPVQQHLSGWATGRSQGHRYVGNPTLDLDSVDETEVHEIDPKLRIMNMIEGI